MLSNLFRSSVCFHATENGQLIDSQKALHALTATVDADIALTKLYQAFKVTNVEVNFKLLYVFYIKIIM